MAIAAAMLAAPAAAAATTSQEAVAFLNQQRAANGIPAAVAFDQRRTTGCHNHNRYMEQNGLGHGEDPSKPGFTPEGNDYSNSGEVLAEGGIVFTATSNPWDAAPLHQTLLFHPSVNSAGYDEDGGFACMRFGFDFSQSGAPAYYAFTSDSGRSNVPRVEVVQGEGPYAPQEAVGINQGVPTGPDVLFFTTGVSSDHAVPGSVSLNGPSGPVEVKLVDSTTPAPDGSGPIFQTGGDLIPVQPLEPLAHYDAAVTWEDGNGARNRQVVSFDTAGRAATLTLSLSKRLSRTRRATLMAPSAAIGQRAVVTLERRSGHHVTTTRMTLKHSQRIAVPQGAFTVTVKVATFSAGDTRYTVKPARRTYR
jgi:hypothetical protein